MNWDKSMRTLETALKWKAKIKARGLTKAKAKCPYCEGYWHGRLAGPKQHLWLRCDGDCGTMLME